MGIKPRTLFLLLLATAAFAYLFMAVQKNVNSGGSLDWSGLSHGMIVSKENNAFESIKLDKTAGKQESQKDEEIPGLLTLENSTSVEEIPGLLVPRNRSRAKRVFSPDPKILCIIQTASPFHETRLMSIWGTWAKLCDDFFAATSVDNPTLHMVDMHVGDDKTYTWGKVRGALQHIYTKKDWRKFDWIIKTDDDAYIVMENLRKFLRDKDPNSKVWYGARFHVGYDNKWVKYMSGPCYVISRGGYEAMMAGPINSNELCYADKTAGMEDVIIGLCLENSGVEFGDARDADGRHKFFPDKLELFLMPEHRGGANNGFWLYSYLKDKLVIGNWECCSRDPIMFHYIKPDMMYILHFVYRAFDHERFVPSAEMEKAIRGTPKPPPSTTTSTTQQPLTTVTNQGPTTTLLPPPQPPANQSSS